MFNCFRDSEMAPAIRTLLLCGDIGPELMRLKRIEERVSVELVVALDPTSRVQFEIGRATHSAAYPWLSWRLLRATCSDWSTLPEVTLLHRLCIRRIGIRRAGRHLVLLMSRRGRFASTSYLPHLIGDGDGPGVHQSQISLVQSPPG